MSLPDRDRVEKFAIRSSLVVYAAAWMAAMIWVTQFGALAVAAVTLTYIGMHVFEIHVRGHCLLSADSTAVPATIIVMLVGYWTHPWLGGAEIEFRDLAFGFTAALIVGHILAIAWCAMIGGSYRVVTTVLRVIR